MRQSRLLGLGHHLLSLASEVCLSPPLAIPREAIILDAQADVCGPALVRVGAPCDHVPAKFRLPLALEGAQSLASPSAISIDDREQEAAPIERGASSSVGSPYADERHVDGVVGQQFILARPFSVRHGYVPSRCLDPNVPVGGSIISAALRLPGSLNSPRPRSTGRSSNSFAGPGRNRSDANHWANAIGWDVLTKADTAGRGVSTRADT